jgi:hypothetical protein
MESFRGFGEALGFQLVDKLAQLVEVYAWPETEGVRRCLWRLCATCLRGFPQSSPDRPIDHFLKRNSEFSGPLLQKPRKIIVDGQRRSHGDIMMPIILMSRHHMLAALQRQQ